MYRIGLSGQDHYNRARGLKGDYRDNYAVHPQQNQMKVLNSDGPIGSFRVLDKYQNSLAAHASIESKKYITKYLFKTQAGLRWQNSSITAFA